MIGYFVLGTLAAYGCFCALWALLGWLLPRGKGCALVCWGLPEEGILSRARWLRGAGFLQVPLIAVAEDPVMICGEIEICSPETLLSRLERERKEVHGTGNGDHPGCGQRRGVSEL